MFILCVRLEPDCAGPPEGGHYRRYRAPRYTDLKNALKLCAVASLRRDIEKGFQVSPQRRWGAGENRVPESLESVFRCLFSVRLEPDCAGPPEGGHYRRCRVPRYTDLKNALNSAPLRLCGET